MDNGFSRLTSLLTMFDEPLHPYVRLFEVVLSGIKGAVFKTL